MSQNKLVNLMKKKIAKKDFYLTWTNFLLGMTNQHVSLTKKEAMLLPKLPDESCPYLIEMFRLLQETDYQFNAQEIDIWHSFYYLDKLDECDMTKKNHYSFIVDYCVPYINKITL